MLAPGFMQGQRTDEPAARRVALDGGADFACRIPVGPGFTAGISLAAAGDMGLARAASQPARLRVCERLGIRREQLYGARQVHSRRVLVVDGRTRAELAAEEADGLLATAAGVVLSVTVADCLPIYLADRRTGAFGIVHSGWKGTGIVREAVRIMGASFGSRPAEIGAVVGPGIGACCYTVPAERGELFVQRYGRTVVVTGPAGPRLDLREANLVLLQEAGVTDVTVITDCTACSPRLGSFRRQGQGFTAMLAWIAGPAAGGTP